MMRFFFFCLMTTLGFSFLSCQKQAQEKVYTNVDQKLWELFEKFEEEASLRGFDIDLEADGIEATIGLIEQQHVAGTCHYNENTPNSIIIDEEFWMIADEDLKEFILFHELGHCKLQRNHREDAFDNGNCISIMRSGVEDCKDNYGSTSRTQYLDELFHPDKF